MTHYLTTNQAKGEIMKTSNPSLLVEKLRAAGFTLTAEGSRLRVAPADSLTDALRQGIREHRAGIVALLAAEAAPAIESYLCPTPAEKMQHRADMAPSRVSCGDCAEFTPDAINPAQGVGTCSVTSNGMPPVASRGYGCCFPTAPRQCPDFKEL